MPSAVISAGKVCLDVICPIGKPIGAPGAQSLTYKSTVSIGAVVAGKVKEIVRSYGGAASDAPDTEKTRMLIHNLVQLAILLQG